MSNTPNMKIAPTVVLLYFAFTTKSCFFRVANATNPPVFDIDGDELQTGVPYSIFSPILFRGGGGGLSLGRSRYGDQLCPGIVVQERLFFDAGTPVIFSSKGNSSDEVVRLSTVINIEFVPGRDKVCNTTTVWKVDNSTERWWVTIDGVKGKAGKNDTILSSWFKIEALGAFAYKFSHCPTGCDSCEETICGDIGKYLYGGQIRLGLGYAWPWVFKQVVNGTK